MSIKKASPNSEAILPKNWEPEHDAEELRALLQSIAVR